MKKILTILICCGGFVACKKEELKTYTEKARIYLDLSKATIYTPRPGSTAGNIVVNFGTKLGSVVTDTITLRLTVTGHASDKERTFTFSRNQAAGDAKEGTDFEILNKTFVIAAGKYDSTIKVVLKRTLEMRLHDAVFGYGLKANDNFELGLENDTLAFVTSTSQNIRLSGLKFTVRDVVTKPANWDSFIKTYFGTYSDVKYRFVIDVLKVFQIASSTSKRTMDTHKSKLVAALNTYNATHPEPLKDENGQLVTF